MWTELACENLTLSYGGDTVIKELTYRFSRGRVYVITGPNGSGKTTLCRALAGILVPLEGNVRPALDADVWANHRGVAAVMLEDLGGYSSLSPADIIKHTARSRTYLGLSGSDTVDVILQQIERQFGRPTLNTAFGRLSGGQQRFVSLLISTINAPDVLIVDEPFTGLDAVALTSAVDVLSAHAFANGIIVLTHNGGSARLPKRWTILKLEEQGGRHVLALNEGERDQASARPEPA